MKCYFLFLAALLLSSLASIQASAQTSILHGVIRDARTGKPLEGAMIHLDETQASTISQVHGEFEFSSVPQRSLHMEISYVGYATRKLTVRSQDIQRQVKVYLSPDAHDLGTLQVFGRLSYHSETSSRISEKNSSTISNIVSAQAMQRSPDNNAASVLQRISGITLQRNTASDEAYAIIRGMEPRYNNTLINGIKMASPDEKSRSVSVNVVPSDLLSRITVSKTLTPDMEGDAIGGSVDLILKNAPDSFSLSADASLGYNAFFIRNRFVNFSKSDIQAKSPLQRNPPGYAAKPDDFSRSNLDFKNIRPMPNAMAGITFSNRYLQRKLGVILSDHVQNLYYGDSSQFNAISPVNQLQSNAIHSVEVSNNVESTHQLNNGLVAHLDYDLNARNTFSLDNFYLYTYLAQARLSTDTTLVGTGRTTPGTGQVFLNDRSLTQHQYMENLSLSGKHMLNPHVLADWTADFSEAGKRAPDRATLTNDFLINSDFSRTSTYFNSIERIWQQNKDHDYTGLLNLHYRNAVHHIPVMLKAGGLYRYKSRYNTQDLYTLRPPTTNASGGSVGGKPVFTSIYDLQWSVFNSAGSQSYDPNNYKAEERVSAGYLMAQATFQQLELVGGLREEMTYQHFTTAKQSLTAITEEQISYTDLLPSLHIKYSLNARTNLRLSYYKSISRPNYYELVPYTIRGIDYIEEGNPYLKHTVAQNLDFRYELYPGGEQQLFAGVFYKAIQDPIELGLVNGGLSGGQIYYTPQNYGTAHNYGAELAFSKYIGHWGLTGNYTYTHSAITTPKILYYKANTNPNLKQVDSLHVMETRPLQGQSDHIVNLSLVYRNPSSRFYAQLAYGYIGKTLSEVSLYYQSDYYQQPMSTLDFSIQKGLSKRLMLFGKFNNLLNTPTVVKAQGSLIVSRTMYARSAQIGIRLIP